MSENAKRLRYDGGEQWVTLRDYELLMKERDAADRALDMERAAHEVTAGRLEEFAREQGIELGAADAAWDARYDAAMQARDWETCEQLLQEKGAEPVAWGTVAEEEM